MFIQVEDEALEEAEAGVPCGDPGHPEDHVLAIGVEDPVHYRSLEIEGETDLVIGAWMNE